MLCQSSGLRTLAKIAASHKDAALSGEVSLRLTEKLDYIKLTPKRILDLGYAGDARIQHLRQRYPEAEIISKVAEIDFSSFADQAFDLILANLFLPWSADIQQFFSDCFRVLQPQGFLLFSSLGPGTLYELAQSWIQVDQQIQLDSFIDLHHLGDALLAQQFAEPVIDIDNIQLHYATLQALFHGLKPLELVGDQTCLQDLAQAYQTFCTPTGKLPATYEVVYGQAWKPLEIARRMDTHGEVGIPISAIKRSTSPNH